MNFAGDGSILHVDFVACFMEEGGCGREDASSRKM